jgi:hypothetical protein
MQLLPPEGIDVPDDDILWTKLINDGDVNKVVGEVTVGPVVTGIEHDPQPEPEPAPEVGVAEKGETS